MLEDFKNQLLADKAAAEERWAKERAALKVRHNTASVRLSQASRTVATLCSTA